MKVEVIAIFRDKYDKDVLYAVGDILDWDDKERIADCTERGLIRPIQEETKNTKSTGKTSKKK